MNVNGISALTIKNSDLKLKCKVPTDTISFYANIQAANELINATPTIIQFAVANGQNVVQPLKFSMANSMAL
jgi:hypothetical protein